MVNRHIKNLILYKLVVVEGRPLREQHERKIHFFREFPEKEGKLRSSHRVTTFS